MRVQHAGRLLERGRTGTLGDIVATIQAEQDEIIRSPQSGVLVVQGGPGTGKTVVALHRAAYLLYTHRFPLEDQGVARTGYFFATSNRSCHRRGGTSRSPGLDPRCEGSWNRYRSDRQSEGQARDVTSDRPAIGDRSDLCATT